MKPARNGSRGEVLEWIVGGNEESGDIATIRALAESIVSAARLVKDQPEAPTKTDSAEALAHMRNAFDSLRRAQRALRAGCGP